MRRKLELERLTDVDSTSRQATVERNSMSIFGYGTNKSIDRITRRDTDSSTVAVAW